MRTVGSLLLALLAAGTARGQQRRIDAEIYMVHLNIPDTGAVLEGEARIYVKAFEYDTLRLDLIGMRVDSVWRVEGLDRATPIPFTYDGRIITVPLGGRAASGVEVRYHGAPQDGLIIGMNAHGRRVAFADNWPQRARYWIPSID